MIRITMLLVGAPLALLWLLVVNPFNFFVPQSERFSWSRFEEVKVGSSIAEVISDLGEPVKVVRRERLSTSCPNCVAYCFAGEPPSWIWGFKEAWLIADEQGRIVDVFVHTEP